MCSYSNLLRKHSLKPRFSVDLRAIWCLYIIGVSVLLLCVYVYVYVYVGERKQSFQFTVHTESSWNKRADWVFAGQSEREMKDWITAFKVEHKWHICVGV